jgi:23S rRNA (cytosine1962-C5)-methyltransferase
VVDRYGPALAVQCLTLGMRAVRDAIVAALRRGLGELAVAGADDAAMAALEGFAPASGWIDRPGPTRSSWTRAGARLGVARARPEDRPLPRPGREPPLVAAATAAARYLDVFAYAGGFACHALAAGAARAVCLESSPEAVAAARRNFELNGRRRAG